MKRSLAVVALVLALPASAQATPTEHARHLAASMGPVSTEAVTPTAGGGAQVTYEGTFTDQQAKVPPGEPLPTGTHLTLTLDPQGRVVELRLYGRDAKLARRTKAGVWDEGCSYTKRCYAVTRQQTEPFIDTETYISSEATWLSNPEYAFVTHEVWNHFANGNWMETGQQVGSDTNQCCDFHPFAAQKIGGEYWEYPAWWIELGPEPTWSMKSAPTATVSGA
jgi:hypothetical protein